MSLSPASPSPAPLAGRPSPSEKTAAVLRVTALALVLGFGFAGIAVFFPMVEARFAAPSAESRAAREAKLTDDGDYASASAAALAAASSAGNAAGGANGASSNAAFGVAAPHGAEGDTTSAAAALVAALHTDGDAPSHPASRIPRPDATTRLYSAALAPGQVLTVYTTNDANVDGALASYAKLLEDRGYTMSRTKTADETLAKSAPRLRIFTKGDTRASITAATSEHGGSLFTIVEGPNPKGEEGTL